MTLSKSYFRTSIFLQCSHKPNAPRVQLASTVLPGQWLFVMVCWSLVNGFGNRSKYLQEVNEDTKVIGKSLREQLLGSW